MNRNIKLQHGFSLIEILIAIAINLIIVIAAANMYLNTSNSQKSLTQQQYLNENGQYALDLIGQDLINAGFYPTIRASSPTSGASAQRVTLDGYSNIVAGSPAAYSSGIFGCAGQSFSHSSNLCDAHANSTVSSDTVVVNYFTNDALGDDIGQRLDCGRSNVATTTENASRIDATSGSPTYSGSTTGLVPKAPLFVSNRYTLLPSTMSIEGRSIATFSLACNGNATGVYQPAVMGIEQLQFRYGVYTDDKTLQPTRFYAAGDMAGLGSIVIDGVSKNAWARVVSVEVCLIARGFLESKTGAITSYTNCAGATVTPTDRFTRRVYKKVFALRNNLTQTIIPSM